MGCADCFGNPAPFPPPITETVSEIQRFSAIPFEVRMAYNYVRTDAMIGRATRTEAWDAYWALLTMLEPGMTSTTQTDGDVPQ